MKTKQLIISLAILLCISTTAYSLPNGKPFIEIDGEIISIKGDISTIQDELRATLSRIGTLEGKVSAISNKITELETKDSDLQNQINDVLTLAQANDHLIIEFFKQNAALQKQIDEMRSNVDENGDLSAESAAAILELQKQLDSNSEQLALNVPNLTSLLAEQNVINTAIDGMDKQIEELQSEIDAKNEFLTADCGSRAIKSINSDGSYLYQC